MYLSGIHAAPLEQARRLRSISACYQRAELETARHATCSVTYKASLPLRRWSIRYADTKTINSTNPTISAGKQGGSLVQHHLKGSTGVHDQDLLVPLHIERLDTAKVPLDKVKFPVYNLYVV